MKSLSLILAGCLTLTSIGLMAGCSDHKPESYNHERPDVSDLNSRDRGLQSSEVVEASDKLAMELLKLPEVNASPRRLTVVFTRLQDQTRSHQFDYNIFLERLKVKIAEQGRDRIAIVTNKDVYYGERNRELDLPPAGARERDDFGQGGGRPAPGVAVNRVQPDFSMTGKVMELPNRGTNYYLFTFSLTDIRADGGGTEIPLSYEVRVRR